MAFPGVWRADDGRSCKASARIVTEGDGWGEQQIPKTVQIQAVRLLIVGCEGARMNWKAATEVRYGRQV
jgi:hypothetical protein